jgi:hypothetical protein
VSSGIPEGKLKLGKSLLSGGLITREMLAAELEKTNKTNSRMAKALLNCNFPSEDDLIQVIARSIRVPNVKLQSLKAAPEIVGEIPKTMAKKHKILALEKIGGLLVIVTPDLGNREAFAAVRQETGCFVAPIRCPEEGFLDTIETFYKGVTKKSKAQSDSGAHPKKHKTVKANANKDQRAASPEAAPSGPRDPEAICPLPAGPAEVNGNQASTIGYYNVMSIWEHQYTGEGPVIAENVE